MRRVCMFGGIFVITFRNDKGDNNFSSRATNVIVSLSVISLKV